jgi:phage tail sheath gpL-like
VPTKVYSDAEASTYFGAGSIAHLAARAAFAANRFLDLTIIGVDDAGSGVAATGTFAISGTASGAGTLTVRIGNTPVSIAIASGTAASAIATALNTAIGAVAHLLPVTASVATATVTVTARNKGTQGNFIPLERECTAAGVTCTLTDMASGANDPVLSGANGVLDTVYAGSYNVYISTLNDATSLGAIKTHLDDSTGISGPREMRPALCAFGYTDETGTLANAKTLCGTTLNNWRLTCAYMIGTRSIPWEVGAAYGAVIASETDPNRPLNGAALSGINPPPVVDRFSQTEIEDLLANGVTPITVDSEIAVICRAITTCVTTGGIADPVRLDIGTPRAMDYVRRACVEALSAFRRTKNTDTIQRAIRSAMLDRLYRMEDVEIVENIDQHKNYVIVETDPSDATRVNVRIPAPIVRGLHVIAARIDII